MKYIELFGNIIENDISEIKYIIDESIIDESRETVFVYSGEGTLYDYITALFNNGQGLDAKYLYKFKVCYEKKDLKVFYSARDGKRNREISSMSTLINELDSKSDCRIVVETDDRIQLAFIVQQLIFIQYPLEKVDILLRKEERDADKTKRFMENVDRLLKGCEKAICHLHELTYQIESEPDENNPTKTDRFKDIDDALKSCVEIKKQLEKSKDIELKFAVAASKKAGKSVIVNCFLGEQIAPTNTELATPNNCSYKKSSDNMYHLTLGDNARQDFNNREEIYKVINQHFREAQNNKKEGFSLPDMEIEYKTEQNNFSSYTIFDTAGPDAAGTFHSHSAKAAMEKCDVAVFAIDYSKYLTTSEEEYLRSIKSMFTAQKKFHSLIFALNKIDVRYTDPESPKSFIMSVDFIKKRLAEIDEAYRDCIIFPTCSLEYFNAIEAEKAGITELEAKNKLPIREMRQVKFDHRDVPELAWLHTHSENLEYYHGIKTISYDIFKQDSGMPALMSYVSYIAKSKARDEIINNVTFQISLQKEKLQSVLDFIANIEELINADDKKIIEISKIITDYTKNVEQLLNKEFSQDELSILNYSDILKKNNGDYNKIIKQQADKIKESCQKRLVGEQMYTKAFEMIWKRINDCDEIDGNEIDKLFTTEDFKIVANEIAKGRVQLAADDTAKRLEKVKEEIKDIVAYRQEKLREKSEACRQQLKKKNVNIELPGHLEFEFATTMSLPSKMIFDVDTVDFKLYNKFFPMFKKKFLKNILIWLTGATEKDLKQRFRGTRESFVEFCETNFRPSFKNLVYENDIAETIEKNTIECVVNHYMEDALEELKQEFTNMNVTYLSCIERFRSVVDDRDKYKADIKFHNQRKDNINSINLYTKDFMEIWNSIIDGFMH